MTQDIRKWRNIGIIAHIDAGKTTVTERMLYYAGSTHLMGNVDDGNTTTDYMVEERNRGITIVAAAVSCSWNGHVINIIDTPGHVDFTAEVERSLRVLDGVVGVFCGVAGVQAQSETVWRQADNYAVPRLAFINKLDRVGSDFFATVTSIRKRLGANAVPVQIPAGSEDTFDGAIDLVRMKQIYYDPAKMGETHGQAFEVRAIPEDRIAGAESARAEMLEAIAVADDAFAEVYFDESFGEDDIVAAIRRQTISCSLVPVLCGAAFPKIGVQPLMNAVCDYLPSSRDIPPVQGTNPKTGEAEERKPYPDQPFSALAFKTMADKYGDLTFIRIYSGTVKDNSRIYNASRDRKEKISRLFRMNADERQALKSASAGDIVAVVGLKFTITGDTLCDQDRPITFEKPVFPDTVISLAIEPKTNEDKERLANALNRLAREDPTFRYHFDAETGQQIISGMGELHLEVKIHSMVRDYQVRANVGEPRVSYRESIRRPGQATGRFIQQTGGRGQYAVVEVEVEPFENDEPDHIVVENKIRGGAIPSNFVSSVEQGIREMAVSGVKYFYPTINVKAEIVDGKFHQVDSSEMAFHNAGRMAFQKACIKAGVQLLEPYMAVEVTTPPQYQGEVMKDLNGRRALITGSDTRGHLVVITAEAPLEEMFGYATQLRSLSSGRATYSMEPCGFREIPKQNYRRFDF